MEPHQGQRQAAKGIEAQAVQMNLVGPAGADWSPMGMVGAGARLRLWHRPRSRAALRRGCGSRRGGGVQRRAWLASGTVSARGAICGQPAGTSCAGPADRIGWSSQGTFSVLEHPRKGGGTFDFLQEPDIGIDFCDDIAHALEIRLAARPTAVVSACNQMFDIPACDAQRLGAGQ